MAHAQRETVLETRTLVDVYSAESATYVKIVAGYTVPVVKRFTEGHACSAIEAQALSAYVLERAASVANSNIDRGSWKELADGDKVAKARDYLAGNGEKGSYVFTDNIGADVFGLSLLDLAAINVLYKANEAAFTAKGIVSVVDIRATLFEPVDGKPSHVARLLNDPTKTEAYHDRLGAEMERILAERHEKKTRTAKSDGEIEIAI